MDLRFHPHDKEYNLLRKILGTLQGESGVNVTVSTPAASSLNVSGYSAFVSVVPTVDTSAYAAGDCVGGVFEIPGAIRTAGLNTILHSVNLTDADDQAMKMWLVLFGTATPGASSLTDQATADLSGAEANILGIVTLDSYEEPAGVAIAAKYGVGLTLNAPAGTSLYGALIVDDAPTFTAADSLTLKFGFIQD